jgi:hypothetical protein
MRFPGWLPALATAALLLAPRGGTAQEAPAKKEIEIDGGGTELFRGLLDHAGIKPLTKRELREMTRFDDVILISLGNARLRPDPSNAPLDRFFQMRSSGSVLIASDSELFVEPSAGGAFKFEGNPVICLDRDAIHRGDARCPYVVPTDDEKGMPIQRIFNGLVAIATNHPTYISPDRWGGEIQSALARFPQDSRILGHGQFLPRDACFAVGGVETNDRTGNEYRLLLLADHSIFINQMLLEPKTDNLELTYRIIEFLQGPGKRRSRCAFFYDGQLIDHFDDLRQAYAKQNQMPLPQVNLWAMQEKLTDLGNAIIDRLQTNNAHNNLILGSVDRDGRLTVIARFLLLLATVVACLFLIRRLWRSRKPSDIPPPPNVPAASTGPPGVFDRRQKELLRRDNVLEPVRDLVRDFFTSIGIHGEPSRMPKVVINDVVRKPDSLRAAIKDFWKIAFGPPQALSVRRWRELEPFFERLRTAHAEGKWRFVVAEFSASPASFASSAGSIA